MKVAILGTGLMGGSIGLAIKARHPDAEVTAFDRDETCAQLAVRMGAADKLESTIETATAGADLIFIATPVSAIAETAAIASGAAGEAAILTDVGSTKLQVVLEVERSLAGGSGFVGGHPMAGSEEAGVAAARPDLFEGAWWILTPTERTSEDAYRRLREFLTTLGARVAALTPAEHDELMAVISHLPQLLATTLMNVAADARGEGSGSLALAAGGFRDVTRVAASDPGIWLDICRENRDAIVASLEAFSGRLESLKGLVESGDEQGLRLELAAARNARRALPGKATAGDLCEVRIEIPDRPGVLAEITTTIGSLGINIEDLGIVHAPEGGKGTLRLAVSGADQADSVADALRGRGYVAKAMGL